MSGHDDQGVISQEIIPVEALEPMFEQWREGNGKALSIIRATSAVISTISSSLLIWMLARSTKRFTTTQHRILLGMSICDIIFSLSYAHFNALAPSEISYMVWNARGNQTSCVMTGGCAACLAGVDVSCYHFPRGPVGPGCVWSDLIVSGRVW